MHIRTITTVVLVPLIVVLTATPAHAIFGSILAGIQRAQMIINQGIQIYEQQIAKITMDGQLTELTDQFSHLKDQALGSVGALSDPFTALASQPTALISIGLSWKDDFTGEARELVGAVEDMGSTGKSFAESWRTKLQQADQVSEQDVLGMYSNHPPALGGRAVENFNNARARGDKRLVLDHAMSDSAAALIDAVRSAVESYETLRNNNNTSNTALQQAGVAGQLTQGELMAAMAQLSAYQAAREAAEDYQKEVERRERLAEWTAAQQRSDADLLARQTAIAGNREHLREGLAFRIHPYYSGEGNN